MLETIELAPHARVALTTDDLATAARELGFSRVVRGEQVHGAVVAIAGAGDVIPGADGVVTTEKSVALAALGADCPCVALVAREAVAVAHSGWRGTVADIAPVAVRRLIEVGGRDVRAWIGPGIGPCCFEVGPEVVEALENAHGPLGELARPGPRGRPHVDLAGVIERSLAAVGVGSIARDPRCTRCDARLHSRRRDGAGCKHQAVIAALT